MKNKTIVEGVKHQSKMMNIWLMGAFVAFACFCVIYAIVITAKNCQEKRGQITCNQ